MMKKYSVATYGTRKKCKNISSQVKFDLAVAVTKEKFDSDSELDSSGDTLSQRTVKCTTNSKKYKKNTEDLSFPNKRRKVGPLFEDDLFGFTEENDSEKSCAGTAKEGLSKFKTKKESSTDCTEDEAYSSSQEPHASKYSSGEDSEKRKEPKRQSPFKYFLKNNVTSLSPKKKKNLDRRFSALPTNCGVSDDSLSQSSYETPPQPSSLRPEMKQSSPSKVRVKREEKQLFTVVRNVKHKHACLEDGETQQFFDDMDFALDGLRQELSIAARCASALDLAAQCSVPSFRVNLRAHGMISKIFASLNDAPSNKTLALCTSLLFYMITRDRLNVDFDRAILGLLLRLLCVSESNETSKLAKKSVHEAMIKRTRKILTRLPDSFTNYIDLENLSSALLAREALLSLTSQRTGEWFKEEMRVLGGLEYIVNIVLISIKDINDNSNELLKNKKATENIERCLKLIENVTFQNRENQLYLVSCKKSSLVVALARLMKLFTRGIIEDQLASQCVFFKNILDCLKSILRVFLNLTHDNNGESETVGQQDGLIAGLLLCVLQVPQYVAVEEQFDILVLALGLLINLVEHSKQNTALLIVLKTPLSYESEGESNEIKKKKKKQVVPAIEALVHLFRMREEAARKNENMACEISDGTNDELKPTKDGLGWVCGDDIDVTREDDDDDDEEEEEEEDAIILEENTKPVKERTLEDEIEDALQRAGKHMEDSMVASYVALLLGCVAQGNKANQNLIRELLPENNFDVLINTLKTFLGFMKLTSGTTGQAIERIIDVLKSC